MIADGALLASQTRLFEFSSYIRIFPSIHQATPLGCTAGNSRFGGTDESFAVLYAACDLATALAERLIRDRFKGLEDRRRRLFPAELGDNTAVRIDTIKPLRLLDLRSGGCLKLGVSTDITGAKCHRDAQQLSDLVYKDVTIDGILYPSRLTAENCVAIFDRVTISHLTQNSIAPLIQLADLGEALKKLNVQLIR